MSPEMVAAVMAGTGVIITALSGLVMQLRLSRELRSAKANIKVIEQGVDVVDDKLGVIKGLVDGGRLELLRELRDVKQLYAASSGLQHDQDGADAARRNYEDQKARVESVEKTKPE